MGHHLTICFGVLTHPQQMRESVMPATIVVVLIIATKDVDAGVFGLPVPRNQMVADTPHSMGSDQMECD